MITFEHIPVMMRELLEGMAPSTGEHFVDCTGGGGGHARAVLDALGPTGRLLIIDQDRDALATLRSRFAAEIASGQVRVISSNFAEICHVIHENMEWIHPVAGIYADLGVSSFQLDEGHRGFSFLNDGPLDMRMHQDPEFIRADEWLASVDLDQLRRVIREYGEEPKAHEIAKAILRAREVEPLKSTMRLAEIIKSAVHYATKSRVHPATRTFQAIRIFINRELDVLERFMKEVFRVLEVNSRLGIITFHSLEDRIVKHRMQERAGKRGQDPLVRHLPIEQQEKKNFELVKPFPFLPQQEETSENSRSRSAKFRVIRKICDE